MATIAEFTLAADGFPLGTVFQALPGVTVQLERVIPDANGTVPYFWVRGAETDTLVEQFAHHPGVRDIRVVDSVDNEYLMRCQWVSEHDSVMDALVDPEVVLLSAVGTADEWIFKIRGESREAIAKFQQFCAENGVPITLAEIYSVRAQSPRYELTDKQREALEMAFRYGYFDTPRESTLEQIASELDISQQAFASRLRRGIRQILENTLMSPR